MRVVGTLDALRLCQNALVAGQMTQEVEAAVASVLSFVVLHLKHKQMSLPNELEQYYTILETNSFAG